MADGRCRDELRAATGSRGNGAGMGLDETASSRILHHRALRRLAVGTLPRSFKKIRSDPDGVRTDGSRRRGNTGGGLEHLAKKKAGHGVTAGGIAEAITIYAMTK